MVEGVQWDLAEGGFRNVFDFLANLRVAELTKILHDENLPVTHGVMWIEIIDAFANRMWRLASLNCLIVWRMMSR